jgi:hypothetical protein
MWTSSNALLSALLATLYLPAMAGVVADKSKPPAAAEAPTPSGYVLRCWQDGQLILEEQHVSAPPAFEASTTKLQLQDRNRQPLYIAETRNATCLVRAVPPPRSGKSGRP